MTTGRKNRSSKLGTRNSELGTLILGWNVGGTRSSAVLGRADGTIVAEREWRSAASRGFRPMLRDFLAAARTLMAGHRGVKQVGVAVGGPFNAQTGTVLSPPHLPGWDGIPLARILRRELGFAAVIEHDAAACLLAEWLWGAAAGCTHAAYLTCGTGCGAGILVDGRILRGPNGETPEVGHIRLAPDGPLAFGKRGGVESFCSGTGISKLAPFMFPRHLRRPVAPKRLLSLAQQGDKRAQAVLDESATRTGQLCALLADIFSPQVIILGSVARYFGEPWLTTVRREFTREGLPANARSTRIMPSVLGERLQALSAIAPCVYRTRRQEGAL